LKKIIAIILTLTVILAAVPVAVSAATSTEAAIIDKHGAKTYIGTVSNWGATWNESNFEEVTNENVSYQGNLTMKSGDVKNVEATGNLTITAGNMSDVTVDGDASTLTITTGVMDDIDCSGKTTVTNGTIGSIQSDGDITLNGGTIKRTVTSNGQITFSGKVTVGGAVSADKIVAGSTVATVNDTVTASTSITLNGNNLKADELNGDDTAELDLKAFTGNLPKVTDMDKITVDASSVVATTTRIEAGTLSIVEKGEFTSAYPLELGELDGPGALTINSGDLLIHKEVTGKPLLLFNNTVRSGQEAFRADEGKVEEDDVSLYDFDLEKSQSDNYDVFKFKSNLTDGITFNMTDTAVASKTPVLIKANVKPAFSEFATGTKMVWELHGDTKSFSISPDSTHNTCTVTFNNTADGTYKAKVTAYLVDAKGDRLTDYKSDSCGLRASVGVPDDSSSTNPPSSGSGIALDTSAVTIGKGNSYWVLAVTDSKTAPVPMSYNSSVATVGKAAAYNSNGKVGWVYPVTGVGKGTVTIDIGGQKMAVTVSGGSIVVDTSSYTMKPGAKYYIGVKMYGLNKNNLNVHSGNSCTEVQYGGNKNGTDIYVITANVVGTGYVSFDIIGGQAVSTQINVVSGASPHGVSGRLAAVAG
jgi:hypothetical protein